MRLKLDSPETPSLDVWLGRDVPREHELAHETLDRLGRERALEALLALHNREAKRLGSRQQALQQTQAVLTVTAALLFFAAWQWPDRFYNPFVIGFSFISLMTAVVLVVPVELQNYNVRLKNCIVALFHYDDSPLVCEPLCRAIDYFAFCGNEWELCAHLNRVLPVMPNDKNALTKTARALLRNRLNAWGNLLGWTKKQHTQNADLQIAILRYFARTNDRDALPAIRKLLKTVTGAPVYFDDGSRVQEAARAALQAFGEPAA